MKRNAKRIWWFSSALVPALSLTALCGLPAVAQQTASQPQMLSNAVANLPSHFDVSAPLAALSPVKQPTILTGGGPIGA